MATLSALAPYVVTCPDGRQTTHPTRNEAVRWADQGHLCVSVDQHVIAPAEAPATEPVPYAELLAALTDLARAWDAKADQVEGARAHQRVARATARARAESFRQAHTLATAALRPGAGDLAYSLANLMPATGAPLNSEPVRCSAHPGRHLAVAACVEPVFVGYRRGEVATTPGGAFADVDRD